jgi:protein-disulfide isomerase
MENPPTGTAIDADVREGNGAGLRGTPSFVVGRIAGNAIDGQVIAGARPLATFETAIDAELHGGR